MSQSLSYGEVKNDRNVKLEDILTTLDFSDIRYLVKVDLKSPVGLKEKTKTFHVDL